MKQEDKMTFSTKYSSKGYFNSKINVSKLVVPGAGTGCVTGCRNPSSAGEQDVLSSRQGRPL